MPDRCPTDARPMPDRCPTDARPMPDRCPTGLFIVEYFFKCSIIVYPFRRRLSTVWRQKIGIFSWKGRASPAIPSLLPLCRTCRDRATAPTRQYKAPHRRAPNFPQKTRKHRPARRPDPSAHLRRAPNFPQKNKKIPPRAPPRSTAPHRRAPNFPQKNKKTPPRTPPRSLCTSSPRAELSTKRQENTAPHAAPIPLHLTAARRTFRKKTRKYRPAHDVRGAAAADRSGPCFVCSRCVRSAR